MSELKGTTELEVLQDNVGTVSFANDVIAVIAGLATTEIPGVAGMVGSFDIGEVLGRKNLSKGVKVEVGKEEAAIDVYIVADYGTSIANTAKAVQENVKKTVENMTGLRVVEVNVHVQSVRFEKETPPQPEPKPVETPRVK